MKKWFVASAALTLALEVGLCRAGAHAQTPPSAKSDAPVPVPVYSHSQAKRGASVYFQDCSGCHLYDLSGGKDPDGLGDAPPLTGKDFLRGWRGETIRSFLNLVRTTMPFDKPGELPPGDYTDVVAYILSVNKMPAGDHDLGQDAQELQQLLFVDQR